MSKIIAENHRNSPSLLTVIKDLQQNNIPNAIPIAKDILQYLNHKPKYTYQQIITQLKQHKPIEYILGFAHFYNNKFLVNSSVLIPRIETEFIVQKTIDYLKNKTTPYTVIDIGTGSGAIIISIAKSLNNKKDSFIAIDISEDALNIALKNAVIHNVNINFIKGSFENLANLKITTPYILLANLPYIPQNEMTMLPKSVIEYEPEIALNGGKQGLDLYQSLWNNLETLDQQPELEAYEIHSTSSKQALRLYKKIFPQKRIQLIKDCYNLNRFIVVEK